MKVIENFCKANGIEVVESNVVNGKQGELSFKGDRFKITLYENHYKTLLHEFGHILAVILKDIGTLDQVEDLLQTSNEELIADILGKTAEDILVSDSFTYTYVVGNEGLDELLDHVYFALFKLYAYDCTLTHEKEGYFQIRYDLKFDSCEEALESFDIFIEL